MVKGFDRQVTIRDVVATYVFPNTLQTLQVERRVLKAGLERCAEYFELDESNDFMRVKSFLLEKPQFIRHNLVSDEPAFAYKIDLLFCRNVLIYFNSTLQAKVVQSFLEQMHNGGFLLLGNHEALPGYFKAKFGKNGVAYSKANSFHLYSGGPCL